MMAKPDPVFNKFISIIKWQGSLAVTLSTLIVFSLVGVLLYRPCISIKTVMSCVFFET